MQAYVYKSPGPDGIHPRILDETRSIIAAPLKKYLKTSLRLKELPYDWQNANISVIHKNGNKSELTSQFDLYYLQNRGKKF